MTVQHHYHCQPENSPPRRFQMFIGRCVFYYPNCIVHFGHIGTLWKKSCLFGFTSGVNVGHFFFFDKALSSCFLPVGNEVHAQEKWLTASLPFVLDVTSTVPPSFAFIFSLQIYVWAMLSVSFTAVPPPPPRLLLLIFPRQSAPLIPFLFSWLTHSHWRSGSWRKRWSRPLQQWTRSPLTYEGRAVIHFISLFLPHFSHSSPTLSSAWVVLIFFIPDNIEILCHLDEAGHVLSSARSAFC